MTKDSQEMDAYASSVASSTIAVADYLLQRLSQIGISHVFGVPGDFNLTLLDHVEDATTVEWVGCCNELNAAYAADGYARVKAHPAAIITTYGVGELSAMNGISGAFAEQVPVIHIVGSTSRAAQKNHVAYHHTLPGLFGSPPDHSTYSTMSEPISCAMTRLHSPDTAAQEIDRVISTIYKTSHPGYIELPTDMVDMHISAVPLQRPLDLAIDTDKDLEDKVLDEVISEIYNAKTPVIIGDVITRRHRVVGYINRLVQQTEFPSFNTIAGRGVIDETNPSCLGIFNGGLSLDPIPDIVYGSDLVLHFGPMLTDSNMGGFSSKIKTENRILFSPNRIVIRGKIYEGVNFASLVPRLVNSLQKSKIKAKSSRANVTLSDLPESTKPPQGFVSQAELYQCVEAYLKPNDVVLTEVGTAQFGFANVKIPSNIHVITQLYYSSIGHALPCSLGAGIALKELEALGKPVGRIVLLEGDGSAQMTIQELGTIIRNHLEPTIFLLNNDGYTIERAIHGPTQTYNDICPNWKWGQLFNAFGGNKLDNSSFLIRSKGELMKLVNDETFGSLPTAKMVEVMMPKQDAPWQLPKQIKFMTSYAATLKY